MTEQMRKRNRFFTHLENRRDLIDVVDPKRMYDGAYTSRTLALTVLTKEVGALAKAILEKDRDVQLDVIVEIAALTLKMYEEVL